jgi:hypothetical protein
MSSARDPPPAPATTRWSRSRPPPGHRAQQPDRARARHHRRTTGALVPQPVLHLPYLRERLLHDRQRLDQHGDVAQRARHNVQVASILDDLVGEEAVPALDAVLHEVAGVAEVLAAAAISRCLARSRRWQKAPRIGPSRGS